MLANREASNELLAQTFKISRSTARRIKIEFLGLKALRKVKETKLRTTHFDARKNGAKNFLIQSRTLEGFSVDDVVFTDEIFFESSETDNVNRQNVRVWVPVELKKADCPADWLVLDDSATSQKQRVMLSVAVGVNSGVSVIVVDKNVKIDSEEYMRIVRGMPARFARIVPSADWT